MKIILNKEEASVLLRKINHSIALLKNRSPKIAHKCHLLNMKDVLQELNCSYQSAIVYGKDVVLEVKTEFILDLINVYFDSFVVKIIDNIPLITTVYKTIKSIFVGYSDDIDKLKNKWFE